MRADELVGRTLGEFVVRARLGEGGYGAVYRAHQTLLGREAVVKAGNGGRTLTQEGTVLGSPPYMAPEQWSNSADADERTDVYALGILAFEVLAGRRPFDARTVGEMFGGAWYNSWFSACGSGGSEATDPNDP
jgi:serine/threonine protein kinase